jgi:hypothetical protein
MSATSHSVTVDGTTIVHTQSQDHEEAKLRRLLAAGFKQYAMAAVRKSGPWATLQAKLREPLMQPRTITILNVPAETRVSTAPRLRRLRLPLLPPSEKP